MSSPSLYPSNQPIWSAGALPLYQRLLPAPFWNHLSGQIGLHQNNRVYTLAVVVWLMISQWLQGHSPLDQAVAELLRGLPASFWPHPCKRLQDCQIHHIPLSGNTAAYNAARQRLPSAVVEACCDRIFEQLTSEGPAFLPPLDRRAFIFDGTSVELPATDALRHIYPPGSNQHKSSHWPLIRMLVAHDLQTGLALRPQWGPLNGQQAVSEQQLLETLVDRLPEASLAIGDANFAVFSVAYACQQRHHPVLLRLTAARALHLAGEPLRNGIDRPITWKPSRCDRRRHPNLPKDACVYGRLLVSLVQPSNGAKPFLLALFTSWPATLQQILDVYGQRWHVETDLRTLKGTLHLEQLRCMTPEMVGKELDLAMAAYNLVRAVMCLAAQHAGLPPRSFSFSRVCHLVQAFAPLLASAQNQQEFQDVFARLLYYASQAKLPRRTRKRKACPRAVWPKPQSYPRRKE